eukprot:TRINITY_DN38641_c0_g1_i1.p2 TRINITY_DN38641_c0_g1~~TRINITY_DN38641_c0_g1_i1.p2  ORF type:complete len:104 (-),score=20.31 TRINITY_DN38641_c0_g1_i1:61-372(-)
MGLLGALGVVGRLLGILLTFLLCTLVSNILMVAFMYIWPHHGDKILHRVDSLIVLGGVLLTLLCMKLSGFCGLCAAGTGGSAQSGKGGSKAPPAPAEKKDKKA